MALKRNVRRRVARSAALEETTGNEKRVFSRVECLMDLEIEDGDHSSKPEDVEAIDLSLLGLGFQRDPALEPLPLGKKMTVAIHGFPPVHAQVRWIQGSRVGVQFCGRMHEIIESWVGEVLAAQGVRISDLFEVGRL